MAVKYQLPAKQQGAGSKEQGKTLVPQPPAPRSPLPALNPKGRSFFSRKTKKETKL